ncbi:MAG: Fe-S cluster assembly protein SufD [Pseudomonadota bacterium]
MSEALSFPTLLSSAVEKSPDDALKAQRIAAFNSLAEQGLPTTRDEDWKYTDLSVLYAHNEEWLASGNVWQTPAEPDLAVLASVSDLDADWLIVQNGLPAPASLAAFSRSGIHIASLSTAGAAETPENPLALLNLSQLSDGLSIHVDQALADQRPIGLLFVDDATVSPVATSRVDIRVEPGCSVNILEAHVNGTAATANCVVTVHAAAESCVNFVRLQDRGATQHLNSGLFVTPQQDSEFNFVGFDLGGALVRHDICADIAATGSKTQIAGLYLTDAKQHVDNHTRVDHRVGPAYSAQHFKGILAGRSRAIWNGKAVVHAGADGTNAEQSNHNILLSRRAEVDPKPELEIYADDVRCAHGTTVGALDDRALFYLQSRGLDKQAARALLVRAFAQQIVQTIPIPNIEEAISERVAARVDALIADAFDD